MKNKKGDEKKYCAWLLIGINAIYILALCVVLFPLLFIAGYNYPSADDWSFSANTYAAVASGDGPLAFVKALFQTVAEYYMEWEGRYSIAFLGALQPGIWGEECYCLVPWIMLGGLILGEMILFAGLLKAQDGANRWLWIPIIVPSLLIQILYTPSVVESFYWYNGSVNYTFVFALSMVFYALFFKLTSEALQGRKLVVCSVGASVLAVLIGGDNFSTSLSSFLGMLIMCVLLWIYNRKGFYRTWYLPLLTGAGIVASVVAPGNSTRLSTNFDGGTTGNAFLAVWQSLVRSFTNMYSWTNAKVIFMVLLIVPFAWMAMKKIKFQFKLPVLFTLLTFGLYASQITATLYVDGTTGGGRMAAILYYSYHVWLVGNVCYWIGWLRRVSAKWSSEAHNRLDKICLWGRRCLLPYCAVCGLILCGIIYKADLKEISVYKAYRDWRQGWAAQYAKEWDERVAVLRDPSVEVVEFAPLSVYPESILYTDLQPKDGYVWVNKDCANYYGKKSIVVVEPSETKTADY